MSRAIFGPEEEEGATAAPAFELQAFAGLPQALGRLCLRDGRPRKEIAAAAGINASMLSGFCSGRRIPSLEHLDRLLTTLGMSAEDLTYELHAVAYRPSEGPLVLWPQFLHNPEGAAAAGMLTTLLQEVRSLLRAQMLGRVLGDEPAKLVPERKPAARRGRPPGTGQGAQGKKRKATGGKGEDRTGGG